MDAERLLRMLGATGKLKGFYQAVYMIEQVLASLRGKHQDFCAY